jgi:hypothetical protein
MSGRLLDDGGADHTLVGKRGRLTVTVRAGKQGEVLLPVRGGFEAFAARADEHLEKNTEVLVIAEEAGRSVLVVPFP